MKRGIDVSKYQGKIKWENVKKSKHNIQFAIIRAGFGKNNIDEQAERNLKECNRLKIPCGIYWFSYARTVDDAKKEARYAVELAKKYNIQYPIYFDYEYDSDNYFAKKWGHKASSEAFNKMCKAFCKEVEKLGYFAGIYVNEEYRKKLSEENIRLFTLWYARYNNKNYPEYDMVQYSSKGTVWGINGDVDMNYCNEDFPKLIRK